MTFLETSAKAATNVEKAFTTMASEIKKRYGVTVHYFYYYCYCMYGVLSHSVNCARVVCSMVHQPKIDSSGAGGLDLKPGESVSAGKGGCCG